MDDHLRGAARAAAVVVSLAAALPVAAAAERAETGRLGPPEAHWIWVGDLAFQALADGRSWLLDADSGRLLGFVAAGYWHMALEVPRSDGPLVSAETHFARTTRGARTDVVTLYDRESLVPVGEVEIPPKRATNAPTPHNAALTDDDRFLGVYNFTPAQSISVVDLGRRRLAAEIDTAGCVLVYPVGPRRLATLCGNGSLLTLALEADGSLAARERSEPFFDADRDPLLEKAARIGQRWFFVSKGGVVHPVRFPLDGPPEPAESWPLFDASEREAGWKVGGTQLLAAHAASGRLFVLAHRGGPDTHKDPGTRVLVYDVDARRRVGRIDLTRPAVSIAVTPDPEPLLVTVLGTPGVEIYDADEGRHLRSVPDLGLSPLVVQSAVAAGSAPP